MAKVKGMEIEEVLVQSYSNIARVYKLNRKGVGGEGKEIAEDLLQEILKDATGRGAGQMERQMEGTSQTISKMRVLVEKN